MCHNNIFMVFLKTLVVIFVCIIFFIILFLLLEERNHIKEKIKHQFREGFDETNPNYTYISSIVKSISNKFSDLNRINNTIDGKTMELPLNQFCMKGSYHSAYDGTYISDLMVKYVLSRGCRFLDFEIHWINNQAMVVYKTFDGIMTETNDYTSFSYILEKTLSNAFINKNDEYYTPNPIYPLFIHMRLVAENKDMSKLFKSVKTSINYQYTNNKKLYYNEAVNVNTPLKKIMNKVIFIFENNEKLSKILPPIPEKNIWKDKNKDTCFNMLSNTSDFMMKEYSILSTHKHKQNHPVVKYPMNGNKSMHVMNEDKTKLQLSMVVPNKNSIVSNPLSSCFIKNHGIQIIMMQYYLKTNNGIIDNLEEHEKMFDTYDKGIVPMAYLLSYIDEYVNLENNCNA